MTGPPSTHTDTPLFEEVAGEHVEYVLGLLTSRPPTAAEVCAAHPWQPEATSDEEAANG